MKVPFKVIRLFSILNIAKTFLMKDFFKDYSVQLTNPQKTKTILDFINFMLKRFKVIGYSLLYFLPYISYHLLKQSTPFKTYE